MPLLCLLQLSKIRKKLISQKTTDFGGTKKNSQKRKASGYAGFHNVVGRTGLSE